MTILRADAARLDRDNQLARARNHELAVLVSFAFHNPKKMPKFSANTKKQELPDEVAQAQVRAFFIGMAGKGA
ncbi:MAG: hypothetical protein ACPG61_11505 [Paracoccaceae bacterium]